jgi:hypothetical protein
MTSREHRESDAREVAGLDSQLQVAFGRNDDATMDRILAEDFVLISRAGRVYTKADLLKGVRGRRITYGRREDSDRVVRVWEDTAVVTALRWAEGVQDGTPFAYHGWFSDAYARVGGEWKNVLSHASVRLPWDP